MHSPTRDPVAGFGSGYFAGFLWAYLYSGISLKVFGADTSLVPWLPLSVVKFVYVAAAVMYTIALFHLFTNWIERVVYIGNQLEEGMPLLRFTRTTFRLLGGGAILFSATFFAFVVVTFILFPGSGITVYEILFATLLWPTWMFSVIMSLFGRGSQLSSQQ
jgi:hypothetical protein